MRRFAMMLKLALLLFTFSSATGEQLAPASSSVAPSATPTAESSPPALDEEIVPTFETQKLARTYILDIPAPRGQITDRNGAPLAQNQLSYNLAINFPTPLEFNDTETLDFAHRQIAAASKLIGRQIRVADEAILRHYHNRGILPFEIATNLSAEEYDAAKAHLPELAEKALEAKAKRGAIVIMDPNNGDILALASWPNYNPNLFVPSISPEKFKALQDDPGIPLLPRAFRSSYPPGSTFKVAVGIAALESGAVTASEQYQCVPSIQIGNLTFHNWKKSDRGFLNFVQALTESCDTWFYQVGIKTGADPIIDWAQRLGFGAKCGIPIRGEAEGRVPNDSYMKATHGRKLLNGDVANLSIGQGDTQVTPLQMAQAMAIVANGGIFYQTRLVQQVQSIDGGIVTAYNVREKRTLNFSPETMAQLRTGMVDAVNAPAGTAHAASLDTITVAGKTGTAQWGPKNKERTAAWFAGYVPAEKPQYAFAALYEGDVGVNAHGGTVAAPMIAQVLKEVYKGEQTNGHRHRRTQPEESPTVRRAEPVEEDSGD